MPGDKTLWSWGYNAYGQLGDETELRDSSPVQVGALTDWLSVDSGNSHILATKIDGTLWSWGRNNNGQLGLGDEGAGTDRSSPEQVGSLNDWHSVSGGSIFTAAVKINGTIWTWGDNIDGQLGIEDRDDRSSPEQVGTLADWRSIICGSSHAVATKTDGTLWTWGGNVNGELGLEDIIDRSSPVQVGSLTNWSSIACGAVYTIALKTDGTLWAWGSNTEGQLGLEDVDDRSSPEQVGSLTTWRFVADTYYQTLAIKSDETLWAWGSNTNGRLGLEDVDHRSSPEQVGTLSDWNFVVGGWGHTVALKTDGTLWTWGLDDEGQLGRDTLNTHLSSPEQVGSETDWSSVTGGSYHTLAIRGPIVIEDVVVRLLTGPGTWCWGHDTDVAEEYIGDLAEGSGTGTVENSGDAEKLTLLGGQSWTLPAKESGVVNVLISYDVYQSGSGGPGTIEYRTGEDQSACEAAGWNTYTAKFPSSGWVQIRVSN